MFSKGKIHKPLWKNGKKCGLPNSCVNPRFDIPPFCFCIRCWESQVENVPTINPSDDTLQGARGSGLESPESGTGSGYRFLTSCMTAPVIKELYVRGCSSCTFFTGKRNCDPGIGKSVCY